MTAAENELPPDNFQETPSPAVAHRTSPTNIGLYLLSIVAARDFGWIGTNHAIARLEATHATMARMERFRGHFYNWYGTRDLAVLAPPYVSSVDSGNLAGHLIALANACREWRDSQLSAPARRAGVGDMIRLLTEEAGRLRAGVRTQTATPRQLQDSLATISRTLAQTPADDAAKCRQNGRNWPRRAPTSSTSPPPLRWRAATQEETDLQYWSHAILTAIAEHREDLASSAADVASRRARLTTLEDGFRLMAMEMEFGFLFDVQRQLLSIG